MIEVGVVSGGWNVIENGIWSVIKNEKWNVMNGNVNESVFVEIGIGKIECGMWSVCMRSVKGIGRVEKGKRRSNDCMIKNGRKIGKEIDVERLRNRRKRVMMMIDRSVDIEM